MHLLAKFYGARCWQWNNAPQKHRQFAVSYTYFVKQLKPVQPIFVIQIDCTFNQDNPLGRHSGESRNPVIKNAPRSGQNHDVVPLPWEIVDQLDSGLRRNDTILANGQSGFKQNQMLL